MTAYAMEGDRQRSLVAGCDGYIQKPIGVDTFPRQVAEFLHGKREHVEEREQGVYLRELNQRLVYRLVNQVEELKRLNQHFVRRAAQLADLHRAVQDITSELGVQAMLEQLLPNLARALGTSQLAVTITEADVRVAVTGVPPANRPRSVLTGSGVAPLDDWMEAEWRLPLTVRGRAVGQMTARLVLPPGAKADEEQLLNIVANQVAIAVENSRLYDGVLRRAAEQQSLVEAGHLLASTLKVEEVLQRFTELVRTRLCVDVVRIWMHEHDTYYRLAALASLAEKPELAHMRFVPGEGAVGRIMEHLTPLQIPDLQVDPRFRERAWAQAEGLLSFVGVPLMLDDVPIGVLLCWTRQRREFTADDVTLAQALATSAAVGIRNARLHEETQLRLRHTETLVAVSQALGATLDLTEVLRRATREMVRALGGDTGVAWLRAPDRSHFVPLVGYHIPKDVVGTPVAAALRMDDPVIRALLAAKGPIAASDSQQEVWSNAPAVQTLADKARLIQEEASRARDIVRDLLQFSRQRDFSPESADVNTVLEQVIAMVRRQGALNAITVEERYERDLPAVELDVSRIKQVFLNIINNAVYVMPNGGSLTVRTETANGGVRIAFADTGPGIAPEHRDRIFDPFFTTKPEVSGTGLGLSVSLGIVQSHGGTIEVETEVGRGTTFTVALPLRLEDESAERSG